MQPSGNASHPAWARRGKHVHAFGHFWSVVDGSIQSLSAFEKRAAGIVEGLGLRFGSEAKQWVA
jgi:hypothetical protein